MSLEIFNVVRSMANSKVKNYIVPGLTSSLIGGGKFGKVRLFEASRLQTEFISPHSHRFNFACLVLRGLVKNIVWQKCNQQDGDYYQKSKLFVGEDFGDYKLEDEERGFWKFSAKTFIENQWYTMQHREIHSIEFSKDAIVLFFEGYKKSEFSYVLEPIVEGSKVPTFKVEDWMFKTE